MYQNKTISIIIPCLNEEEGISKVINRIPDYVDAIIVVDNGSTDNTAEIASSLGAQVVSQPQKGYGRAYKAGFHQSDTDIIVTSDGDGTYPVEKISEMVEYLIEKEADFVSGCRFPLDDNHAMRTRNFIGNMIITTCLNIVFRVKLYDGLSGMWVFNRKILDTIILKSNRWSLSQEIKIEVLMRHMKFIEYHIPYAERIGNTKLWPFSVGFENMFYLVLHKIQWVLNIRKRDRF